jgi:predicted phosphodiesterase
VPFIELSVNNVQLAATHQRDKALRLSRSGKYDFVFYGHSHKPWKEKIEQTILLNPGTLAGMFFRATFAIFNTQTRATELIILDQLK